MMLNHFLFIINFNLKNEWIYLFNYDKMEYSDN